MSYKVKANAPELGDDIRAGTLFPVDRPMRDQAYVDYLKEEHPEQYEKMRPLRRAYLRALGVKRMQDLEGRSTDPKYVEKKSKHIHRCRGFIRDILAASNGDVHEKEKGFLPALHRLATSVRDKAEYAFSYVPYFGNRMIQSRMEEMADYGGKVNNIVMGWVEEIFPGQTKDLGWRNDTMATHKLGRLQLMGFDPSWSTEVRYEAKRKWRYMLQAHCVFSAARKRKRHLEFLATLMHERVYDCSGEKQGSTAKRWLKTIHDPDDDNRCIDYEFLDEPPDQLADNEYIEPINFRTIEITLEDGSKRKINYMVHLNEKSEEAIFVKSLRHPERSIDELLRDLNRARLLFENEEEMELAINEMKRRIENPESKKMKKYKVSLEKEKAGVGGDKENPAIPCTKFNWVIDGKDFEFQAFTPKNYANYFLWKPYAWCRHKVERFFNNNLCKTTWPEAYFSGIDEEAVKEEFFEREYQREQNARKMLPKKSTRLSTESICPSPSFDSDEALGQS